MSDTPIVDTTASASGPDDRCGSFTNPSVLPRQETPDVASEVSRLASLGARRLEAGVRNEHGTNWGMMADPEGNEFCVCDGGTGG